ncbi:hypothetical protein ACIPUB_12275 [Paeniglutamicibacter sp. ORCA_105]|uniref:hypothetical protein n=1 Tax=Paeniglutamicibacter sp. ORCA_105 TaxID=3377336 RepID=UPI003893713E
MDQSHGLPQVKQGLPGDFKTGRSAKAFTGQQRESGSRYRFTAGGPSPVELRGAGRDV